MIDYRRAYEELREKVEAERSRIYDYGHNTLMPPRDREIYMSCESYIRAVLADPPAETREVWCCTECDGHPPDSEVGGIEDCLYHKADDGHQCGPVIRGGGKA